MFVNEEDVPLISSTVAVKKSGMGWKFILGSVSLSVIGLLVVSLNGGMSRSTSSSAIAAALAEKRVKMSKDGTLYYSSLNDVEKKQLFNDFVGDYKKKYENKDDETRRYGHFLAHLQSVDDHNKLERENKGTAVHGISVFADMSVEEFTRSKLGYRPKDSKTPSTKEPKAVKATSVGKYKDSTSSVDWTGTLTTPVKDQGMCGSCWAISTTEQIESDGIRAGLLTPSEPLSVQQLVSCDNSANGVNPYFINYGCNGGFTETAYGYVFYNGGMTTDAKYPSTLGTYLDSPDGCTSRENNDYVVTVDEYYEIPDENSMMEHVLSTGPLSICVDATTWQTYTSGIVSAASCGTTINHCVQVVGLNQAEGYWIVRNSWGTDWGYDGHIYIATGGNACNLTYSATYVDVVAA